MPEDIMNPETAPEESTTEAAPQEATEQQDTFDREYVEKLRKEAAGYRTKLKELQEQREAAEREAERAKMDDLERLQAELEERDKLIAERDAEVKRERAIRNLANKVIDPEAAFKLADGRDDLLNDEGEIDADKVVNTFQFLAPQAPGPAPVPAANTGRSTKEGPLGPEDFRGKPADWVRANLHRLKQSN